MPIYDVKVTMVDAGNRKSTKRYQTANLTDFAAAQTAANGLISDLQGVTMARVLAYSISQRTVVSDAVSAGANIDEGVTIQGLKADNYQAPVKIPAPTAALWNSDGTVDMTNAELIAYLANFETGNEFTISDGEQVGSWIGGTLDK